MHRGRDSRKEAFPVFGVLEEWTGKSTPGIFDGQGLRQDFAEHAVPRQDIIGRSEAWEFLEKVNNELGEHVLLELTDAQAFLWHRYMRSHIQFQAHASQHAVAEGQRTLGPQGERGQGWRLDPGPAWQGE